MEKWKKNRGAGRYVVKLCEPKMVVLKDPTFNNFVLIRGNLIHLSQFKKP
jgi:hypothetical protein